MKKRFPILHKPGRKKINEYLTITLLVFLFVHLCSFISDGFGTSRSSGYWNDYAGHMSYTEIPARIKVREIIDDPDEKYTWEVLQFGCKLDNQQELLVDIEESGIPKEDIQTIFYKPDSFDGLNLEPGSTYLVSLDIHANFYSFLFKHQYGFSIFSWRELNEGETGQTIGPYPGWKLRFVVYAIACWLQVGLFFSAIFFVYDSQEGPRIEKKFTAWLVGIYSASTVWIVFVDQPFYRHWADYLSPGIAMAVGLGLILYAFIAFQKPDAEDAAD